MPGGELPRPTFLLLYFKTEGQRGRMKNIALLFPEDDAKSPLRFFVHLPICFLLLS